MEVELGGGMWPHCHSPRQRAVVLIYTNESALQKFNKQYLLAKESISEIIVSTFRILHIFQTLELRFRTIPQVSSRSAKYHDAGSHTEEPRHGVKQDTFSIEQQVPFDAEDFCTVQVSYR